MKCKKHPKYKGIHKPRVACEMCWVIFLGISETCHNCGCMESLDEDPEGSVIELTEDGPRRIR